MTDYLNLILGIATSLGRVKEFHRYGSGYISVEGVTDEGKKFTITLSGEEEEENA